jgi:methionyl-tRNA formyltransferase
VACGTGALRLVEVQRAGGRRMSGAEFMRGGSARAGDVLVS